ncbi:RHS repeat domain-containing protein [Flavobacterium nitrogenifigens]|uniref:RHS repeat domain-containing protein n=1 Tax=Flavobacterium nitrogenifigens TaxID=1617283 RepID=UPI0011EE8BCF|nr:VCBS repeat-containing protein [Flavobacterium nitrogenifigens]
MKKKYLSLILFIFTIIISAQTPTGSSTEAGLTAGKLSVSLTGAANYAVPINLPPGINEVVPRVSLAYNSQGVEGMAANGWDIAGISKIKRISKTRFHDGNVENYKLTPQDRFALDGQRLMLKSGTYGTHNSVYELEKFSQVKITMLYGMIEPWEEIQYYFMAEYPDGSKAMYGNKSDAQSAYEWAIVSWENAQGVKINYSYNTTGGYLSIATIRYGSRGLTAHINEVRFTYTASQRKNENYIANGYKIIRNNILSKIEVISNGTGYRNYFISYTTGDRISSITEKNGDNSKNYNPTVFTYENTTDNITYAPIGASLDIGNITASNAAAISGDFDDDGKMDCIIYPKTGNDKNAKYWLFNDITSGNNTSLGLLHNVGAFEKIFPTTWLSWNNKMMPQGWTIAKKTATGFDFTVWSTSMSTIIPQYTRTVNFPTTPIITKCYTNCNSDIVNKIYPKKIISGDFNGDGLTDVIAFDLPLSQGECVLDDYSLSICELRSSNLLSRKVYFIDLKRDNTSDYLKYAGELSANITDDSDTDIKVADFNGDGKSDFYIFYRGTLRVYSLNEQNNIVLLYENSVADSTLEGPLLFGDFNGDGKSDFMGIPPTGSTWYKYTSTGISYLKETKNYTGIQFPAEAAFTDAKFITLNYNNDKLTDLALIVSSSTTASNVAGSVNVKCFINNNGDFTTSTGFTVSANTGIQSTLSFGALPIFVSPTESSSRDNNFAVSTLELAFINKNKVHFFNSQKNYLKDNLIKTVTIGNGVTESVSYTPLNSAFKNNYNSIYNPSSGISNFPNMDITINSNIYLVSKVEKQSSSVYKKRLFAYYGAVSSLDRREFIGFRSVSQSDWHDDSSVIFSTVYNNNIDLRAANIEKFTVPYMYYPYGSASPSDFTTKQLTTYETAVDPLRANKVYKLKILNYKNFNSVTDINNETAEIQYDTYNNITSSKTYTKKGSALTKTMTITKGYDFVASPYIVGRPKNKTVSITANNHTMTSTEAYTYNSNNLLSNTDKSATGTSTISESCIYDIYGNVTKKTITSQVPVQSRSTLFEYDTSGRFITKITDNDNLTATYEYYTENGLMKKETTPYKSFSYTYDSWLKKITQKNNLLNTTTTYSYAQNASKTIVTTTEDPLDGNIFQETFDDLGRKISTGSKDINGSFTYVSYVYDIFDRLTKKSEPYFGTTPAQWNETQYDIYSRPIQNISFNGKIVSNVYNKLVTTNTEGLKSKVITKDAVGNTVSVSETSAGEITYNYFADGNLKQISYNGISLDIEQDGWGRKTKFKDPSNGDYTYAYNDYDELTEEKSQNGNVVTTITRDSNGRAVKKTIIGGGQTVKPITLMIIQNCRQLLFMKIKMNLQEQEKLKRQLLMIILIKEY